MRSVPFLFCRYRLTVDDEELESQGQLEALRELQGKYYAVGPKAEREKNFDSLVMRPRSFKIDQHRVLTWSVGQHISERLKIGYDSKLEELELETQTDDTHRYSDFVAIPTLGVLAIDDRVSDTKLGPVYKLIDA